MPQTEIFFVGIDILLLLCYIQMAHMKNDTVIEFLSPTVELQPGLRTFIHLDNFVKELKPFDYHDNPEFSDLPKKYIQKASIIIVEVRDGCSCPSLHCAVEALCVCPL